MLLEINLQCFSLRFQVDTESSFSELLDKEKRATGFNITNQNCFSMVKDLLLLLSNNELIQAMKCTDGYKLSQAIGLKRTQKDKLVRWGVHSYLDENSVVIEAGGHMGVDVHELNSRWHPGNYHVLEPIKKFYDSLKKRFEKDSNIKIYDYGIGSKDEIFYVDDTNDATSVFKKSKSNKKEPLKIVAAKKFLKEIGVPNSDVDLLTMNCEGCEYDLLDYLISSGDIQYVKNVQFQAHRIAGVCLPVTRYCIYQHLLKRTHQASFMHKFWWESWKRIKS